MSIKTEKDFFHSNAKNKNLLMLDVRKAVYERCDGLMARKFEYTNKKGEKKTGTAYTLKEQSEYHSMRARKGSINPMTKKPFKETSRQRSRGWIDAMKTNASLFKLRNKK